MFCCCQANFIFLWWRKNSIPWNFANAEQAAGIWSDQEPRVWHRADNSYTLSAVYMCRSQLLVFHYQPGVCSGTSALCPSQRSQQQQQPRGKWCQGRTSPSWWIPDAWTYYFATTSSHTAKKHPKPNRKPPWNSLSPQATVWRPNILLMGSFSCHPFGL